MSHNPVTAIKRVSVEFVNGQVINFQDDAGLPLGKVKIAETTLKEEIKAITPPRASRTTAAAN